MRGWKKKKKTNMYTREKSEGKEKMEKPAREKYSVDRN